MPADRRARAATTDVERAPGAGLTWERQLVSAMLARDRKAAAEFVSTYADSVYGYVGRRLAPRRDLVEDLVQEVFLTAFDRLATFQGTSSLRSWLLGIARHKVEDYYRDQLRKPISLDAEESAEPTARDPSVEELLDRAHAESRTHDTLRRLPEPYGLVLLWRYWENRSAREIAAATGKTEKAIERLLARARAKFRTIWEES